MAAHKHGKKGRVTIDRTGDPGVGGVNYPATEWDGDDAIEEVEVTNTESDGHQEMDDEGGVDSLNGSITIIAVKGQAAPTKGMANLVLYEGGRDSIDTLAFKAFIGSVKRGNKVKGTDAVTWQLTYKSSGAITVGTALAAAEDPDPYTPPAA